MENLLKLMKSKSLKKLKKEMKKQETKKDLSHLITNRWKDLSDTAKSLNVPVSVVLRAREHLKTNQRDKVIEHIKEWFPANNCPIIINKITESGNGRRISGIDADGHNYRYEEGISNNIDKKEYPAKIRDYDLLMGTGKLSALEEAFKTDIEEPDPGFVGVLGSHINVGEIRKESINHNATQELINNHIAFKELVFTITESDQSWWSRLFRSPKNYRINVTGEGIITNPIYHGLSGMQCYNKSVINILAIVK